MLRLVEADPKFYSQDSATAFDPETARQVTLHIRRRPRRSRALRARRDGEIRYTALDFELDIQRAELDICPLHESTQVLRPDPSPDARLVLLGNAPMDWHREDQAMLRQQLPGPVGVLPTAAGEAAIVAEDYLGWLQHLGIAAELLPITLNNIERSSRDRQLLGRLGRMGSLLLTGGDQRRLTETLLHCAEATPVLHAIVTAYERGTPVVAVAASATAMASRMIAEGDSLAALRYGSSEDASGAGAIVERGIGITRLGLVDQHFVRRRRLGRLLMACAEQRQRFGFGLCEGSGLVIHGGTEIEAIGQTGVVIAELDIDRVRLAPLVPDPDGIRLYILEPGQRVTLENLASATSERSVVATALLESTLADMASDYRTALGNAADRFDGQRWKETITTATALH